MQDGSDLEAFFPEEDDDMHFRSRDSFGSSIDFLQESQDYILTDNAIENENHKRILVQRTYTKRKRRRVQNQNQNDSESIVNSSVDASTSDQPSEVMSKKTIAEIGKFDLKFVNNINRKLKLLYFKI